MAVNLQSTDAARGTNTTPLVELDGSGGHVPYVRLDPTPTQTYTAADAAIFALLTESLEVLKDIRDEVRASRLALADWINSGATDQLDYLELAQSVRDSAEEA